MKILKLLPKNIIKYVFFTVLVFLIILSCLLPAIFDIEASSALNVVRAPFLLPLNGDIVVKFRQEYFDDKKLIFRKHTGIDIAGKSGDIVRASGSGVIMYTGFSNIGGRTIVIKHNDKIRSTYLNILDCFVINGERVSQGDIIATIGSDDDPSYIEPHLHFGIIYKNSYLDPEDILGIDYTSISRFISLKNVGPDISILVNRE